MIKYPFFTLTNLSFLVLFTSSYFVARYHHKPSALRLEKWQQRMIMITPLEPGKTAFQS